MQSTKLLLTGSSHAEMPSQSYPASVGDMVLALVVMVFLIGLVQMSKSGRRSYRRH